jgi:hypothetical protein
VPYDDAPTRLIGIHGSNSIVLTSNVRGESYDGVLEQAATGLHGAAFTLFRKYVPPGSKVVDLGSGAGAFAKRLHDASYALRQVTSIRTTGWGFDFSRSI